MIRRFMEFANQNKALREQVEVELKSALTTFVVAKAVSDDAVIQEAVAMPSKIFYFFSSSSFALIGS